MSETELGSKTWLVEILIPKGTPLTILSIDEEHGTATVRFELEGRVYRCEGVPLDELERVPSN